jgi:hypothetical protein
VWRGKKLRQHRAAHAAIKTAQQHLQTTLIEAAKLAPRFSPTLAMLYDREKQRVLPPSSDSTSHASRSQKAQTVSFAS